MKNQIQLLTGLFALLYFSGCGMDQDVRSFMPGTYVSHATGEYSIAEDTLLIAIGNTKVDYQLERRTAFRRIREGQLLKPEYERERWQARFDQESQLLVAPVTGQMIRFEPDSARLFLGDREFRKLQAP